jgi:peptidoglycan hydrolase-like protein with peptidoglycan-binding domain
MLKAAQLATKDLQGELARLGYYHGPVDGVPRPETTNAIRSFQADEGLAVTGQVDPNLIGALLSRSNAK